MSHWRKLAKKLGDGNAPRGFNTMRRMIQPILTATETDKYMADFGDIGLWEWVDRNYGDMFRAADFGCKSALHPNRPAADSPLWVILKKHLAAHSPKSRAVLPDSNFYVAVPVEVAMPYGRE
jgi:hypothetical protein